MTTAPAAAGQPSRDDLTERIFRALYQEFDLRTINGTHIVVPKGTPWFTGTSLGDIARQISDHDHPGPAASPAGPGQIVTEISSPESPPHLKLGNRSALGSHESYCVTR
jgi:hypothetical protein